MARLIPISLGARFINTTTDMQAAAPAEEITRLLRMLGASPAKVAGLVLFEALWLALLATMLGMLGGHGLVELIGHWLQAERRGLGASAGAGCGQFGGFAASAGCLSPGCDHAAQQPIVFTIFIWRKLMKSLFACLLIGPLFAVGALAAAGHADKETREDIARHRAMAAAHEGAAKCLEAGKKEDVCLKDLQVACKGLAIGKYCGMKHEH